jgi:hypothetical protein
MDGLHRRLVRQRQHYLALVVVVLALFYRPATGTPQTSSVPYKHAYYLFLEGGGAGCEECYVPLLITQNTLEQIAAAGKVDEGLLIITYERDSIWQGKGKVSLQAAHILSKERTVRLNTRKYRYQEIGREEVLKLLEHPMGTIPISRPQGTGMPVDGPSLADLIKAFKEAK